MNKWTRRGFIAAGVTVGGALVVGVALREGQRAPKLAGLVAGEGETLVNVWVKISQDNRITAIIPHSEMGQGVFTSLAQMLAEEMDADWSLVDFQQAPAHEAYANYPLGKAFLLGEPSLPGVIEDSLNGGLLRVAQSMSLQITGGSGSVRFTGQSGMRIAGAAAREMLVSAAAAGWNVPEAEIRTEKSRLYHDASRRSAPYAEFAAAAGALSPPVSPQRKAAKDYQLIGKSLPRLDIPAKVDGTAAFAMDVDLPGMRYAAVMSPPVHGAKVASLDDTAAKAMPGVHKVLNEGDFVAIVADSYWRAEKALAALRIGWSKTGRESLQQAAVLAQFRTDMTRAIKDGDEQADVKLGDARGALAKAAKRLEAEYTVPYLAHAAMEPINAVAAVKDRKVDLWIGHQNPLMARDQVAEQLGYDKQDVTVHNRLLGGGFGRKSNADYPIMAVRIAARVDGPVKMIWSREQDIRQDFYRPATVAKVVAGLGADGMPVSWDYQFVHKDDPKEASAIPYAIPAQFIHYAPTENPLRFGPWRSVDHTQHGFLIESFIDELAHATGKDPLAYRRALLAEKPRHVAVLDAVAAMAGWGRVLPEGHGLGVALVESFGTIVAEVAEVDMTAAIPRVSRVWVAADPGFAVNPDGFAAQMESGVIYGLSAALHGNITLQNGAVAQSNFDNYPVIRMDDAPAISVRILNSGARIGGGGEPGTPPIAPAVANAIFAATSKRFRTLPLV